MIVDEDTAKAWVRALPECDAAAWDKLERLLPMLVVENGRQNLVAKASIPHIWQRHVSDSAQLLLHVPRETSVTWLDLGTGAGFPGIIVSALRRNTQMTMVESRSRRVDWLQRVIDELELTNARVVGSRLEKVPSSNYDVISARAFAPLEALMALSARFSTIATTWVLPKGQSAAQELQELRGWRHSFHVEPSLTDPIAGIVVGTLAGRKG